MLFVYGTLGLIAIISIFQKDSIVKSVEVRLDSWNAFDRLYKLSADKYGLPWEYVKAIALIESNNGLAKSVKRGLENPSDIDGSKSSDGKSWGIMQVTLTTAKDMDAAATVQKLNNAAYSIDLGARYLSKMMARYRGELRQLEYAVKAYNQGPGNTDKEVAGRISGYAQNYYDRFVSNLETVRDNP